MGPMSHMQRLEKLYNTVRNHSDITKRTICDIFAHLPTKQELPEYYKIIKKPMEMERIQQKMHVSRDFFFFIYYLV